MSQPKYLTSPPKTSGMPPGIPYIVGNEAAERFTFYGLKGILVVFMTQYLLNAAGEKSPMGEEEAKKYFHLFVSAVYFFPFLGAILSDAFLGKYRTIILLSIVYCLGPLVMAVDSTRTGLFIGLALIAIGSGGIKPCVSAHVGDQFGQSNQHLLPRVFSWFYFSINLGSSISMLIIPRLLQNEGPALAFGLPAGIMGLATLVFWMGRHTYAHIPPAGMEFVKETFSWTSIKSLSRLIVLYLFIAVYWSLYDQSHSAWVLQAGKMDRTFFGQQFSAAQLQAINPILILLFIPLFSYVIYPLLGRFFNVTPLRKIGMGMFLAVGSFLIPAWIEQRIMAGEQPHAIWQVWSYVLLTAGEILISITGLEFAYTQAPKKMKSLVMSFYMLSLSLGNFFTSAVNHFIQNPDQTSKLAGPAYYLFFAGLMLAAAILFIPFARWYKEENHLYTETAPSHT
ncbi:MAG: POT family MFS transporter [Verrucomicrobiota bacterium]|nr:POT family MFS transporter [Verrucomicrobiota bacterium]